MTIENLAIIGAAVSLLIGSFFILVGAIGLLRFGDPMARLHAPTKVGTLGIGMLIIASLMATFATGEMSINSVLIMAFLFVTAPVSAHFIAKTHLHRGDCTPPPAPARDETWSTLKTYGEEDTAEGET